MTNDCQKYDSKDGEPMGDLLDESDVPLSGGGEEPHPLAAAAEYLRIMSAFTSCNKHAVKDTQLMMVRILADR